MVGLIPRSRREDESPSKALTLFLISLFVHSTHDTGLPRATTASFFSRAKTPTYSQIRGQCLKIYDAFAPFRSRFVVPRAGLAAPIADEHSSDTVNEATPTQEPRVGCAAASTGGHYSGTTVQAMPTQDAQALAWEHPFASIGAGSD